MWNKFFILAHRGVSDEYPENTMEAFKEAFNKGMDGIELDVQLSKDEELVVIHDERVDRTSNKKGLVKDFTLEELKKLDVGSFKDKKFKMCRIPTLEEVLEFFQDKGKIINIELKTGEFIYEGIEEKVLKAIEKYNLKENVLITSFNHQSIKRFRELDKEIRVGILLYDTQFDLARYVNDYNIEYINPSIEYIGVDRGSFSKLKKEGKVITTYTVNSIEKMKELKKLGINIITNIGITKEVI